MSTLVIVTGGSSGIGRALLARAPAGAHRVDVSRSGPETAGLDDVAHVPADLADPGAWPDVAARIAEHVAAEPWERVALLHAAGTLEPIGFAGEVDGDAYRRSVLLSSAAGQVLGERFLAAVSATPAARRELVLLSSGAARTAYPGWSAYGAGKAALDQWARVVAAEQAQRGGVRVCAVAPGVVATPMQARIRQSDERDFPHVGRFHQLHEQQQLADPDEVARGLWALLDEPEIEPVVDLRAR